MHIDPWGSSQVQDYARLRDEFGISPFGADEWSVFASPHRLFRRGVPARAPSGARPVSSLRSGRRAGRGRGDEVSADAD